ncbi:biogenesis of lysosome-related organelles complex 1 subunit 3 [Trichomycterus rosablanca]|uniref:biogenesis of lysosome-related organelles complex 1 subunit 3 n=1 Tax=Trichomycterus rosablanca TaxID=2290929 RepID=UPI002F355D4B
MADRKSQIVVEGEASESDSDQEVYMSPGLTVPGEASETDSEGEEQKSPTFHHDLPPLTVHRHTPTTEHRPATPTPGGHLTSLLQQKLQESNARLRADLDQSVRLVYLGAARDVKAATAHLSHSQGVVIATSHTVRVAMDDLRAVCDKIDIITGCRLLPDINMTPCSASR